MTWKYHDYFLFTIIGGGGCLEIELKRRTDRKLQLNSNFKKKTFKIYFMYIYKIILEITPSSQVKGF